MHLTKISVSWDENIVIPCLLKSVHRFNNKFVEENTHHLLSAIDTESTAIKLRFGLYNSKSGNTF